MIVSPSCTGHTIGQRILYHSITKRGNRIASHELTLNSYMKDLREIISLNNLAYRSFISWATPGPPPPPPFLGPVLSYRVSGRHRQKNKLEFLLNLFCTFLCINLYQDAWCKVNYAKHEPGKIVCQKTEGALKTSISQSLMACISHLLHSL